MSKFLKNNLLAALLSVVFFPAQAQLFEQVNGVPFKNRDSRSANWVDINDDGWLDIFITNGKTGGQNNEAYINNGNGTFTELINSPMVLDNSSSDGATWADTDGNAGLELFVATWHNQKNLYYQDTNQMGRVSITNDVSTLTNSYSETGAFGDYDQDGFVDLIVTNSAVNKRNDLFKNNGDGTFTRISNSPIYQAFTTSRGINWVDFDNDNDLDVFITNETAQNNELYINQAGTFSSNNSTALTQFSGNSMSSCWGDYDNDGDLDVFISNHGSNNKLFRNDGSLIFTEMTTSAVSNDGGFSFSANWGDIDNDGDLDLVVGNAFSSSAPLNNFLYLNNGNGSFTKNTSDTITNFLGWTFGNAFGDYDKDGDLDLLNANCFNTNQANQLFKNLSSQASTPNSWTVITAVGTISNHSAIGAKLFVKATINGQALWQMREISSQSSYCGQNMLAAHFGLGNASSIDSLIIIWPNGLQENYTSLAPNQYLTLIEGQGLSTSLIESDEISNDFSLYPNPSQGYFELSFELDSPSTVEISLFDLSGKQISQLLDFELVSDKRFSRRFNLSSNLGDGIYLLQILLNQKVISKKLVIGFR